MEVLTNNIMQYWPIVAGVISPCAAISAATPSKSDDRIMQIILDIINKLGLNVFRAKNADGK